MRAEDSMARFSVERIAGITTAAKMAIIPMAISVSHNVKAAQFRIAETFLVFICRRNKVNSLSHVTDPTTNEG